MIRINFNIESIITEQSLVDDTVNYRIVGSSLGVPLHIPVPVSFIERLDQSLQTNEPVPRQTHMQPQDLPAGYDIGVVDEMMYMREEEDDE